MEEINQSIPQQTPIQQETSLQNSNSNWLKTLSIGLGVIGIGILIGIGGYLLGTKKSQPPVQKVIPQPSPTSIDETANWKTYENTQYGYLFKYPDTWAFKEEIPSFDEIARQEFRKIDIDLEMIVQLKKNKIDPKNPDNIDPKILERLGGVGVEKPQALTKDYDQISGTLYRTSGSGIAGTLYRQDFIFTKAGRYFWIIFNIRYDSKDTMPNKDTIQTEEQSNKTFDQILSTFKFTN